jgi:predicted RNase H-like HicB family nuclease|tara:strand:- start:290 stop:403 length:114 start_codon:yes stop_codon:yes gene_type:complete
MLKYTVILIPEEEGDYSVEVPALPGPPKKQTSLNGNA